MAITDKHKSNTITTIATYKPSIRSKYTRYTEIIPPRERRKIFNSSSSDDDDSSSEEEEEEERRRGRSRNSKSRSRSRSPIFSGRNIRRRNNNTRSRGIMFCADELSNLIPPTTNQIKGLSEYKPIELKTFVSKTLIAQVERQVNATKMNRYKPTPHVVKQYNFQSISTLDHIQYDVNSNFTYC